MSEKQTSGVIPAAIVVDGGEAVYRYPSQHPQAVNLLLQALVQRLRAHPDREAIRLMGISYDSVPHLAVPAGPVTAWNAADLFLPEAPAEKPGLSDTQAALEFALAQLEQIPGEKPLCILITDGDRLEYPRPADPSRCTLLVAGVSHIRSIRANRSALGVLGPNYYPLEQTEDPGLWEPDSLALFLKAAAKCCSPPQAPAVPVPPPPNRPLELQDYDLEEFDDQFKL